MGYGMANTSETCGHIRYQWATVWLPLAETCSHSRYLKATEWLTLAENVASVVIH